MMEQRDSFFMVLLSNFVINHAWSCFDVARRSKEDQGWTYKLTRMVSSMSVAEP
jgi:hypothetical protein